MSRQTDRLRRKVNRLAYDGATLMRRYKAILLTFRSKEWRTVDKAMRVFNKVYSATRNNNGPLTTKKLNRLLNVSEKLNFDKANDLTAAIGGKGGVLLTELQRSTDLMYMLYDSVSADEDIERVRRIAIAKKAKRERDRLRRQNARLKVSNDKAKVLAEAVTEIQFDDVSTNKEAM